MRHVDLFTGILGFSLAAERVWGDDYELVLACEIDPFCRKVIEKHRPGVPIVDDVNDLESIVAHAESFRCGRRTEAEQRPTQDRTKWGKVGDEFERQSGIIDLVSSGTPCQPASVAGLRLGEKDPRWLWPQTLAVVKALEPRWLLLENPLGITSMAKPLRKPQMESKKVRRGKIEDVYEAILTQQEALLLSKIIQELKDLGYRLPETCDGIPIIPVVPACALGAPHRRDRVWIVAHSAEPDDRRYSPKQVQRSASEFGNSIEPSTIAHSTRELSHGSGNTRARRWCESSDSDCHATNHANHACDGGYGERESSSAKPCGNRTQDGLSEPTDCDAPNTNKPGSQIGEMQPGDSGTKQPPIIGNPWDEHWYEAATRLCRMDVRLPGGVDRHRTKRLKALGTQSYRRWQNRYSGP